MILGGCGGCGGSGGSGEGLCLAAACAPPNWVDWPATLPCSHIIIVQFLIVHDACCSHALVVLHTFINTLHMIILSITSIILMSSVQTTVPFRFFFF